MLTACFLINRMPSRVIMNSTPAEKLLNTPPNYQFLRVFGCACWPNLRPYNNHKLSFRSKQCIFLGYSSLHHGYKCLDRSSGRVYISRDVVFDENIFRFVYGSSSHTSTSESSILLPLNPEQDTYIPRVDDMVTNRATNPAAVVVPGSGIASGSLEAQVHVPGSYVDHTDAALHGPCMGSSTPTDGPSAGRPASPVSPAPSAAGPQPSLSASPASSTDASPSASGPLSPPAGSSSRNAAPVAEPVHHHMRMRLRDHKTQPRRLFDGLIRYDPKKRAFAAEPASHVQALTVADPAKHARVVQ